MKDERGSIDAAREIKKRHNIPIVFIAPDADVATVREAIAAEPDGFLIKPLDERELIAAIEVASTSTRRNKTCSRVKGGFANLPMRCQRSFTKQMRTVPSPS